jgi:hypothetical protein
MKNKMEGSGYKSGFKSISRVAAAVVAIGIASAPALFAKPKTKKAVDSNLGVIAHVQLENGSATRMFLVQKNGRRYLYLGVGASSSVCVFDVTMPAAAHRVERFEGAGNAQAAEFQLVGDTLSVSSRPGDASAGAVDAAGRSVTILNMSDPANPQTIQTFSGVTSTASDDARGLIYLSNKEGLWVVQAKQPPKPDAEEFHVD